MHYLNQTCELYIAGVAQGPSK